MKKTLLKAAMKAAPMALGVPLTTKDLRVRAAKKAALWAADRVADRVAEGVESAGGAAGQLMRKQLRRHRKAPPVSTRGASAAKGLAAAALALPLGLWVGSRLRSEDREES